MTMNRNELINFWKQEEQKPFSGWDFSYLDGRMLEEEHPWSYTSRAVELMLRSSSVIDLGTGGGERFLKLQEYWPKKVSATEGYPPNFRLATVRLAPFGVRVVEVGQNMDEPLPFANAEFDLILNRHSGFNPQEIARILAAGGVFLTQQVHGLSMSDLMSHFDSKPPWPFATPEFFITRLIAAGLIIRTLKEWSGKMSFTDVGALVYYLKAVPWIVSGFSVDTHLKYLLSLQRQMEEEKTLTFTNRRYLIEACKKSF
jgi:SAM-dependent methyltransferase